MEPKTTQELRQAGVPFSAVASQILEDLTKSRSAALTGLSNTGKSTLMRAMAGEALREQYRSRAGRPGVLIYIDCNRAVAVSAQAFYEIVLRSILETLEGELTEDLSVRLHGYHQEITEASEAFRASLKFNLALAELCEGLEKDPILLIDEFDEIYAQLEERALVNLRALRDRFGDRLRYVVATVRRLTHLRGQEVEGEFAEMFSRSTYRMPALDREEAEGVLERFDAGALGPEEVDRSFRLAGGHPGLLIALAQMMPIGSTVDGEVSITRMLQSPQPGAECMKIWSQLTEEEQSYIQTFVLRPEAGLPRPHRHRLERLGLLENGKLFSPVFEQFVGRKMRAPEVDDIGIYVDHDSGDVWVDGVRIPVLTDLEFRLLELLDERRDKLTDKYTIVTEVWGEEYLGEVDDARVEKLISRLRAKIEPEPSEPRYLITRRGRGYKLFSQPRIAASEED